MRPTCGTRPWGASLASSRCSANITAAWWRRVGSKRQAIPSLPTAPTATTIPETFILESLKLEDEQQGRLDGKILYDVLRLNGQKPIYYYFRTQGELVRLSEIFRNSGYRYLHLSCHGSEQEVAFTFSSAPFSTFADIFEKKLHNRRLFISGCSLGNRSFADLLFAKNGGMYSIIAPTRRVFFNQTTAFWSAFYYLMHAHSTKEMKRAQLEPALRRLSEMFEMPVAYYFKQTNKQAAVEELLFGVPINSLQPTLAKGVDVASSAD